MTTEAIGLVATVVSLIAAASAAFCWFRASTVVVPEHLGNKVGPEIIVGNTAFIATAMLQAEWNKRGAISAGTAALAQAFYLATSLLS